MNTYKVINKTNKTVSRGGYFFYPKQTVELKLNERQRFFLSASSYLILRKVEKEGKKEAVDTPKNEKEVFVCRFCDKEYKTTRGLNNHLKKEHGEVVDNE